jgi:AbrB family looped-hinge helix DNA binding protein
MSTDSRNVFDILSNGEMRTVQQKGEVTLPKEWRDAQGVEAGDEVAIREREDGRLEIIPPS